MNPGSLRARWSVRVYTIVLVSILGFTITAATPSGVTVEPMMTKGAASAPVTIVEFSDYQ